MLAREGCWEKIFRNYTTGEVGIQFTEYFLFRIVKSGEWERRLSFLHDTEVTFA